MKQQDSTESLLKDQELCNEVTEIDTTDATTLRTIIPSISLFSSSLLKNSTEEKNPKNFHSNGENFPKTMLKSSATEILHSSLDENTLSNKHTKMEETSSGHAPLTRPNRLSSERIRPPPLPRNFRRYSDGHPRSLYLFPEIGEQSSDVYSPEISRFWMPRWKELRRCGRFRRWPILAADEMDQYYSSAQPSSRVQWMHSTDHRRRSDYAEESNEPYFTTTSRKGIKLIRMQQGPREYVSCKDIGIDFCARTSSHGIPFIGTHSFFGKTFWAVVTSIAFCAFAIQTYFTLSDYLEYRTIIEMQIKFEPAPFPAATICNLNAFKLSEVIKFEEIEQGIKLWEKAISQLNRNGVTGDATIRKKRQAVYRPVYAKCVCNALYDDQCIPQRNEEDKSASICLCYEDVHTGYLWPCYLYSVWKKKTCFICDNANTLTKGNDPDKLNSSFHVGSRLRQRPTTCLCQSVSHHCVVTDPEKEIQWWTPQNHSYVSIDGPSEEVERAFDIEGLKDLGAITTKTKENIIFMVAGMSRDIRKNLSYTLEEFVLNVRLIVKIVTLKDFKIHIDPEYGNCFTFNFNDSVELKNSRAGPMYGLRLLLNVNQSDYMPMTEAAGVRIVVHEQDQEPFPDTFGYSAPTGFVSSFGLKTKIIHRLDAPYGKCSDFFRPKGYIYEEHYSVEGCYRNCFQHTILERCNCGDPRFPLPLGNHRPCDARNAKERACLANQTQALGGFHHLTHDCHCVQPCTENVFETAYSAATWPAENFNIGADCIQVLGEDDYALKKCTEYYRKNTALIEIYYEQLNFESLRETPGYTLVNLFSDLGGNIGLWIGFSLITVLEVIELIFECLTYAGKTCIYKPIKKRRMSRAIAKIGDDPLKPVVEGKIEEEHPSSTRSKKEYEGPQGQNSSRCSIELMDATPPDEQQKRIVHNL